MPRSGDWTRASCSSLGLLQVSFRYSNSNRLTDASFLRKPTFLSTSRKLMLVLLPRIRLIFIWTIARFCSIVFYCTGLHISSARSSRRARYFNHDLPRATFSLYCKIRVPIHLVPPNYGPSTIGAEGPALMPSMIITRVGNQPKNALDMIID